MESDKVEQLFELISQVGLRVYHTSRSEVTWEIEFLSEYMVTYFPGTSEFLLEKILYDPGSYSEPPSMDTLEVLVAKCPVEIVRRLLIEEANDLLIGCLEIMGREDIYVHSYR